MKNQYEQANPEEKTPEKITVPPPPQVGSFRTSSEITEARKKGDEEARERVEKELVELTRYREISTEIEQRGLDLKTENGVTELMKMSLTPKEWNDNGLRIKEANEGGYPVFWHSAIVESGLADEIKSGFK